MASWKKVENEAGYPCYIDDSTGEQYYDHPEFQLVLDSIKDHENIKYSSYRIAFKVFTLQKQFKVPPLRICSGVFARHQLSLSESSLSLDCTELEAVLADIYFATEKEGLFTGDVDSTVDLLINLLLNVYDQNRKEPLKVLAAKSLLILLSEESVHDKWLALSNCSADHNGCVSQKRLAVLLGHVMALPQYLRESCDNVQQDIETCFSKDAGMLGISSHCVADWGASSSRTAKWLPVVDRIRSSRDVIVSPRNCSACGASLVKTLQFKCSKCTETYFCEKCYLCDNNMAKVSGHKKSHLVHEIVDGQVKPNECLSFIKTMRRFFFCTKTKRKKTYKKTSKKDKSEASGTLRRKKDGRPAIFTSTVSKASGNNAVGSNPTSVLQDIISHLETQNRALQELSSQLQNEKDVDLSLKGKVDVHSSQISAQITRLKMLKDNLQSPPNPTNQPLEPKPESRPQAFDLFSPIPIVDEKQSKVNDNIKTQPRVLSLDSGNFSVTSKHTESRNLLTMSGDALKPVAHMTTDSISTVSMNDISSWYNDQDPNPVSKRCSKTDTDLASQSISATERRFADDIRSVEHSNDKMKELNADLDTVLDRLQQILSNNFAMDESYFDNTQLRETANEMEGLLGTLIRGVEQRATLNATKGMV